MATSHVRHVRDAEVMRSAHDSHWVGNWMQQASDCSPGSCQCRQRIAVFIVVEILSIFPNGTPDVLSLCAHNTVGYSESPWHVLADMAR